MYQLVTYEDGANLAPGCLLPDGVHPIAGAPAGADGLWRMIGEWERWEPLVLAATKADPKPLSQVRLRAPLQYPGKLLAAGSNYRSHAAEMRPLPGSGAAEEPFLFLEPTRHAIVGPGDAIVIPTWAEKIDWEVELAVVIGATARNVSAASALDYVFGYTIMNDVTSRQGNRRQDGRFPHDWFSGKGLETFCPMGPAITPAQFFPRPPHVALKLWVNDTLMQDGHSSDLTFDVPTLVAYASSRITLDPGDVISTGTPSGVGAGRGVFLKPGDQVRAMVEGIGSLENAVVAEDGRHV